MNMIRTNWIYQQYIEIPITETIEIPIVEKQQQNK